VAASLLPITTAVLINVLNGYARDRLDASIHAARVVDSATREAFLCWASLAGGMHPGQLAQAVTADRRLLAEDVAGLHRDGVDSRRIADIDRATAAYNTAVDGAMRQLMAGQTSVVSSQALAVLFGYQQVDQATTTAEEQFQAEASRAQSAQLWGGTSAILLASLLLAGLLLSSSRRQRRAAVLKAEADALRQSERGFRLLFEGNPQPMWVFDPGSLAVLAVNDAAVRGYGYSGDEFLGMRATDLLAAEDVARFRESVLASTAGRVSHALEKHVVKGGRAIDVEVSTEVVEFRGQPATLLLAQDVTERRSLERQLEHRAFHDPLTGLPNRALFDDRVRHALARSTRSGAPCAVLMIDLDDFKTVNDGLGHATGDELLIEVGERLGDVVRPGDTLSRLGGDEFAILAEDLREPRDAQRVAEQAIAALRQPFALQGATVSIGASLGIALSSSDSGCNAQSLVRDADVAMYAAKRQGVAWATFGAEMRGDVQRRLQLRGALTHAIENREFVVYYQPLVDVARGRPTGVEALVRWQHPSLGLIPPLDFIPLAEESGQIVDIGRFVLREALGQMARWNAAGVGGQLEVSVNVSCRQLLLNGFADEVVSLVEELDVRPDQLILEITESTLMRDQETSVRTLDRLRRHGVKVAIDDFGTGYSSLTYLRQLPIDEVKIDKSFVSGIATTGEARSMMLAIIRLVGALDVETVVEGIEDADELAYVAAMGCDRGQGYLFARPMPAEQATAFLTAAIEPEAALA
jgi:diguanylate cyclase (GGDEF)-like protein/PAS domain S-box-containing protein